MAIVAGLAIAAIGAGVSAQGAAQNASKQKSAAWAAIQNSRKFTREATQEINDLYDTKVDKLTQIGTELDRLGGGYFGDTETLKNLRTAQDNFSDLAAGDFAGFESLLRQQFAANLANSSASPIGTYTKLGAETQFGLMQRGLSGALQTSEFLGNASNQMLGLEFGLLDQRVNTILNLKQAEVNSTNAALTGAAQSSGAGTVAAGQAIGQLGSSLVSYGSYSARTDALAQAAANNRGVLNTAANYSSGVSQFANAAAPVVTAGLNAYSRSASVQSALPAINTYSSQPSLGVLPELTQPPAAEPTALDQAMWMTSGNYYDPNYESAFDVFNYGRSGL